MGMIQQESQLLNENGVTVLKEKGRIADLREAVDET